MVVLPFRCLSADRSGGDGGSTRLRPPPCLRPDVGWSTLEEAKSLEIESAADLDYADQHRHSDFAAMHLLSNLDKHRRLALTAWWPDIVYWMTDGESNRRFEPGDGTFDDGSIVGYVTGSDEGHPEVVHDFSLTLSDLSTGRRAIRRDVVKLAEGMDLHYANRVDFRYPGLGVCSPAVAAEVLAVRRA